MATQILKIALSAKQTITVAESCTAGLLAVHLSDAPGASDIFSGGIVAYTEDAKSRLLNVNKNIINRFGVVSEEVASSMAEGALEKFGSDWAISTTGYSGPTGGTPKAPLGTLCVAICGPHGTKTHRYLLQNLSRREHQESSCELALRFFLTLLNKNDS